MLKAQNPLSRMQIDQCKFVRKPLQPKNILADNAANPKVGKTDSIRKVELIGGDSNKENIQRYAPPKKITPLFDSSLAEELSEMRKRIERLRLDKEKTERRLKERESVMEMWLKELEQRGQAQKMLEIELDRVFRFNQLKALAVRVSPVRSLREKEEGKRVKDGNQCDAKVDQSGGQITEQPETPKSENCKLV